MSLTSCEEACAQYKGKNGEACKSFTWYNEISSSKRLNCFVSTESNWSPTGHEGGVAGRPSRMKRVLSQAYTDATAKYNSFTQAAAVWSKTTYADVSARAAQVADFSATTAASAYNSSASAVAKSYDATLPVVLDIYATTTSTASSAVQGFMSAAGLQQEPICTGPRCRRAKPESRQSHRKDSGPKAKAAALAAGGLQSQRGLPLAILASAALLIVLTASMLVVSGEPKSLKDAPSPPGSTAGGPPLAAVDASQDQERSQPPETTALAGRQLQVLKAARELDINGDGRVDLQELQAAAFSLGQVWSTATCRAVVTRINGCDSDSVAVDKLAAWFSAAEKNGELAQVQTKTDIMSVLTLTPQLIAAQLHRTVDAAAAPYRSTQKPVPVVDESQLL